MMMMMMMIIIIIITITITSIMLNGFSRLPDCLNVVFDFLQTMCIIALCPLSGGDLENLLTKKKKKNPRHHQNKTTAKQHTSRSKLTQGRAEADVHTLS